MCDALTSHVLSAFVIDILYSSISHHTWHWDSRDYYSIMAEQIGISVFLSYQMEFKAAICGDRIYKATWSPVMNKVLICKKDKREEAQEYDLNADGVYKDISEQGMSQLNLLECWLFF